MKFLKLTKVLVIKYNENDNDVNHEYKSISWKYRKYVPI